MRPPSSFCTSSPFPPPPSTHSCTCTVLIAFPRTPSEHPDPDLELDRVFSARPRPCRPRGGHIPRPANVAHRPGDEHPLPEPKLLARRISSLERSPIRTIWVLAPSSSLLSTRACIRAPPCVAGRRRSGRGCPYVTDKLRPGEPRHPRVPRAVRVVRAPWARRGVERTGNVRGADAVAAGASATRPGPAAPGDPRRGAGAWGREHGGRDGQLGLEGQRSLGEAVVRLEAWGLRLGDDAVCVEVVLGWLWVLGSSVFGLCCWTGSSRVGEWRTT